MALSRHILLFETRFLISEAIWPKTKDAPLLDMISTGETVLSYVGFANL